MGTRLVRAGAAWLPVLALLLVTLASPSPTSARAQGRLDVSPGRYYAGQSLTWTGDLGVAGKRTIRLQRNLGRAGDAWEDVEGFRSSSRADGSFSFSFPGPGMRNVSYRVVADGAVTQPVSFTPRFQEVVLGADPTGRCAPDGLAVAGEEVRLEVDTAPPAVGPNDPFPLPGRELTLQRRVQTDQWDPVATGAAGDNGLESFPLTLGTTGEVVYRVRMERWTTGGDDVGWFPSFPTYVDVVARPAPATALAAGDVTQTSATLTWSLPADASRTEVVVTRLPGGTAPTQPGQPGAASYELPAGRTAFTDSSLQPSTEYTWAVFTRNGHGVCDDDAPAASATTLDPPPPSVSGRSR